VVVCIGDSNTEAFTYSAELRATLQACYGERGLGYVSLGPRRYPVDLIHIDKQGTWEEMDNSPKPPPHPWFAVDGFWTASEDTAAGIRVAFPLGEWGRASDRLGRTYDGQQRVRIHYQTGPNLGSFKVMAGGVERLRVDCRGERPGYGLTEAFLCDGFEIGGLQGRVVLLGFDGVRESFVNGQPQLAGGVLVHALGNGWGMARETAATEPEAFAAFMSATKPDLITVLLGTNDMHNEGIPERYQQNLTETIKRLQAAAPGVGGLVISCPEAGQTRPGSAAKYRDLARDVARARGCAFWSLTDLIGSRSQAWTREGFYGDGLHYNRIGGAVIAKFLLRGLQFDPADLKHCPALTSSLPVAPGEAPAPLRPAVRMKRLPPVSKDLAELPAALAQVRPLVNYKQDLPAAELRLAIADDQLALWAIVHDARCGASPDTWPEGTFDLYLAADEKTPVRQMVFRNRPRKADGRTVTLHVDGLEQAAADIPVRVTGRTGGGYEIVALVPLRLFQVAPAAEGFLLESSVVTDGGFTRLFGRVMDRGAFRDSSQSARIQTEKE